MHGIRVRYDVTMMEDVYPEATGYSITEGLLYVTNSDGVGVAVYAKWLSVQFIDASNRMMRQAS